MRDDDLQSMLSHVRETIANLNKSTQPSIDNLIQNKLKTLSGPMGSMLEIPMGTGKINPLSPPNALNGPAKSLMELPLGGSPGVRDLSAAASPRSLKDSMQPLPNILPGQPAQESESLNFIKGMPTATEKADLDPEQAVPMPTALNLTGPIVTGQGAPKNTMAMSPVQQNKLQDTQGFMVEQKTYLDQAWNNFNPEFFKFTGKPEYLLATAANKMGLSTKEQEAYIQQYKSYNQAIGYLSNTMAKLMSGVNYSDEWLERLKKEMLADMQFNSPASAQRALLHLSVFNAITQSRNTYRIQNNIGDAAQVPAEMQNKFDSLANSVSNGKMTKFLNNFHKTYPDAPLSDAIGFYIESQLYHSDKKGEK